MSEKHIVEGEQGSSSDFEDRELDKEMDQLDQDQLKCTPNEDIERIKLYETTVEVIGHVDSMDAPKQVGSNENMIFKFFINNKNGHHLQVIAWNKEIERIRPHVVLNQMIHIDGAMAVPSKEGYQFGTLPFELTVRSNTIINNLGVGDTLNTTVEKLAAIPVLSLKDAVDSTGIIKVHEYIKNNFLWVGKYKDNMEEYGVGAITDGTYKLEIRFSQMNNSHDFSKGDKVEILGRIRYNSEPTYLTANSLDDVVLLNETRMPLIKLLQGTTVLSRKRSLTTKASSQQQGVSSSCSASMTKKKE